MRAACASQPSSTATGPKRPPPTLKLCSPAFATHPIPCAGRTACLPNCAPRWVCCREKVCRCSIGWAAGTARRTAPPTRAATGATTSTMASIGGACSASPSTTHNARPWLHWPPAQPIDATGTNRTQQERTGSTHAKDTPTTRTHQVHGASLAKRTRFSSPCARQGGGCGAAAVPRLRTATCADRAPERLHWLLHGPRAGARDACAAASRRHRASSVGIPGRRTRAGTGHRRIRMVSATR